MLTVAGDWSPNPARHRRVGAIVSGPIIAIGSLTALGQRGIFLTCAVLTLVGLVIIAVARRTVPGRS